jgi:transposase
MAAWLGLTPRQMTTGGKPRLLGISKRGNRYLRKNLIHGARAALPYLVGRKTPLGRRPRLSLRLYDTKCPIKSQLVHVSGIVYVIRNGLQWKDAPPGYGPHKTLYNRFIRWSRLGVFDRIFAALASEGPKPERIMIDATHLKAHRTAASLLKKGLFPAASGAPKAA